MSKTFCGNLPAMSVTPRRLRNPLYSSTSSTLAATATSTRPRGRSGVGWGALLMLSALFGVGCDSAPDREPVPNPAPTAVSDQKKDAIVDDDEAAMTYLKVKAEVTSDPELAKGAEFPRLRKALEGIANGAGAPPLRANASLLLGQMFETRGDPRKASGFYQHAAKLVPDDAGPHMALAGALARADDVPAAIEAQATATDLDPDNLENWLALGELKIRGGDEEGAVGAYAAYELRRKGLIDGLTLHDEAGTYVVGVEDRIGCANALAAAADQGTAMALIYALHSDPEPRVRATIARVMGTHRLASYLPVLKASAEKETDPDAKEAVAWALSEIARDPVEIQATERPRLPDEDPRGAPGEVPAAAAAPVAPTEKSTLAPAKGGDGAADSAPAGKEPAEGSAKPQGSAPSPQ